MAGIQIDHSFVGEHLRFFLVPPGLTARFLRDFAFRSKELGPSSYQRLL